MAALTAAGKNVDHLTIEDLASYDQLHTGGMQASRMLATLAAIAPGERVLDVGGGLGGPARMLAKDFGARVTVIDLTAAFIETGAALTARTGLTDSVTFQHGDATAMPFPDGSFDVVWTQHATMNIAAKDRLYAEIVRVLRPGGRLVFHEIMAGANEPLVYPVPWAGDASISFMRPPDEIRAMLRDLGLVEKVWRDTTSHLVEGLRAQREQAAAARRPVRRFRAAKSSSVQTLPKGSPASPGIWRKVASSRSWRSSRSRRLTTTGRPAHPRPGPGYHARP